MSISGLILIQLVFLLLVSWLFAAVAIRKLKKDNNEQATLISELRQGRPSPIAPLERSARDKPSSIDEFQEPSAEEVTAEDMASVLDGLDSEFENSSENVSDLDAMLQAQSDSIARLKKMREAMDSKKKDVDTSVLNNELVMLKEKNERSEAIIAELKTRLENGRSRTKYVESQINKLRSDASMIDEVARENKRLSMDKAKLDHKLKKEMYKYQQTVDRIQARLSAAENKSREGLSKAQSREQSLLNTILQLQEQMQDSGDGDKTEEEINALKNKLTEAQEALERAVSEKEFLETNFLDLEQALEESSSAKEELDRTRKEYEMLEKHYLELEKEQEEKAAQFANDPEMVEHRKKLDKLAPVEPVSAALQE